MRDISEIKVVKNKGKNSGIITKITMEEFIFWKDSIPTSDTYLVEDVCCVCEKKHSVSVKILKKRKIEETKNMFFCSSLCATKKVSQTKEWKETNSIAQKKVQCLESVKQKNREGVLRSRKNPEIWKRWHDGVIKNASSQKYRDNMSLVLKEKWKNSEDYRNNVLNSQKKPYKNTSGVFISNNSGDIFFESLLELFYLFFMDLNGKKVERFNDKIEYSLDGKNRFYFPDFLVDNNIVEIKSYYFLREDRKLEEINEKIKSALKYIKNSNGVYKDYFLITEKEIKADIYDDMRVSKYLYTYLYNGGYLKVRKICDWSFQKTESTFHRQVKAREIFKKWEQQKL